MKAFPRRVFAPRPCRRQSKQTTAGHDLRQTAPVVEPAASRSGADKSRHCEERLRRSNPDSVPPTLDCFVASLLAMTTTNKRKAERRKALFRNLRALTGAARPLRGRSPLGVPPRRLRQRPNATAQLEPRDFLGTRSARPPRWFERRSASQRTTRSRQPAPMRHSRALPAPYCPSPARLHPQTGRDAVRACLAQAAREPR